MDKVRYGYALLDDTKHTVSIDDIDRPFRRLHKFYCPHCNNEMYAILGKVKLPHFRHRNDSPCNPDNYLHSTAEAVFFEEYQRCLNEGIPFTIDVYPIVNYAEKRVVRNKDFCESVLLKKKIILTNIYKKITREKKVEVDIDERNRRPDLLLESEDKRQLWVEIWVSHKTDEKKLRDGSVLEIKISSEKDIQAFRTHELVQENPNDNNVKLYIKEDCLEPHTTWYSEDNFNPNDLKACKITVNPEYFIPRKPIWVDLGLPSGTLWSNYVGSMSFDKAQSCFAGKIPSVAQFEELVNSCKEMGPYPAGFAGCNGNFLEFYEGDFWTSKSLNKNDAVCFHREFLSKYCLQIKLVRYKRGDIEGNCYLRANKTMNLCVILVDEYREVLKFLENRVNEAVGVQGDLFEK